MGKDVRFRSPADARAIGIEAVYQDLAIVDQLSLWRNFFLGKEIVQQVGPVKIMERRPDAAGGRGGAHRARPDPHPLGRRAGLGALGRRAAVGGDHPRDPFRRRLLLLDEPTAALSVRETRNVLESIGRAREQGLGVLYIDHNMGHVLPVADRIVLLELGRVVRVIDRGEVSVEELQDLVAGRSHLPCELDRVPGGGAAVRLPSANERIDAEDRTVVVDARAADRGGGGARRSRTGSGSTCSTAPGISAPPFAASSSSTRSECRRWCASPSRSWS